MVSSILLANMPGDIKELHTTGQSQRMNTLLDRGINFEFLLGHSYDIIWNESAKIAEQLAVTELDQDNVKNIKELA